MIKFQQAKPGYIDLFMQCYEGDNTQTVQLKLFRKWLNEIR